MYLHNVKQTSKSATSSQRFALHDACARPNYFLLYHQLQNRNCFGFLTVDNKFSSMCLPGDSLWNVNSNGGDTRGFCTESYTDKLTVDHRLLGTLQNRRDLAVVVLLGNTLWLVAKQQQWTLRDCCSSREWVSKDGGGSFHSNSYSVRLREGMDEERERKFKNVGWQKGTESSIERDKTGNVTV